MQEVYRKRLMPAVNLTCVRTDKFKTGCLSVTLMAQLDSGTAAKNALLPAVLRRGTAVHPSPESIDIALAELYGARIEPLVRKKGDLQCVGFYADFADDDFVPPGEHILERMAALLGEMLLMPNTRGGQFLTEYVERERENLIDQMRASVNEKRAYSIQRLIELMCDGERYGVNKLGSEASARKITAAGLTKQYRQLISTAAVEVFYCGAADFERVRRAVEDALCELPRSDWSGPLETELVLEPKAGHLRTFEERLDVTQGKMAVGFRLGQAMAEPNYAALRVFNAVYGGAVTSKLFLNVREKLSLCYFASSMLEEHKGLMIVSSGIAFEKYDRALSEILAQLEAVKNGQIDPWELESAKLDVVNTLRTAADQPVRLENYYLDAAIAGFTCTPEELAGLADCVTAAEVQKIAGSVQPDTVYFLTGGGEGEK